MSDRLLWAPSVNGLCLWHEADKDGEEGYRCVAPMDEALAGQYAEILNELGEIDTMLASWRIAGGWFTPTKECLEDGMLRRIGHYPLEPRPGDVVTNGKSISDFKHRAVDILPNNTVSEDDRAKMERLKPNAAADSLRKQLDDLDKLCQEYDQIRSTGRKPLDPNYPPSLPSGHQNLLQSLWLMSNQIACAKAHIGALLNVKPFLAGDLTLADRDLLTIPDSEDEDPEGQEEGIGYLPCKATMTVALPSGAQSEPFDCNDQEKMAQAVALIAEELFGDGQNAGQPEEKPGINYFIPMSGKALGVILKAAAAKPGKGEPSRPIHSVGIGERSICATDQYKIIIVGDPEQEYRATVRTEALVEASASDLRGEFVHWDAIELMKPDKEGEPPPPFPDVGKVVLGIEQMVDVGRFSPLLLKQVASVAEALGAVEVRLFRSRDERSMLAFQGSYMPMDQLDLFADVALEIPFKGLLCGRAARDSEGDSND